jgi:transposase-like protein
MQDFIDQFATEEACRQYVSDIRWDGVPTCPTCKGTSVWKVRRELLKCKTCRRDFSVTAGTAFGGSRIPLRIWFQALWCMVSQKNGVSALGLGHALGIKRYETAWYLLQRIRGAMVRPHREQLEGLVEVDEVFIGGVKPGKRGRGALGKVLILVAVEDKDEMGIGRIRIEIIGDATAVSLRQAIRTMIESGSTIRTDEWKGYTAQALHGYQHTVMKRHSLEPGEDPTPLVHRIASLLKRWLLGTHHGRVEETHLRMYLNEFIFRFNRRKSKSRGKLFYRLIQQMTTVV